MRRTTRFAMAVLAVVAVHQLSTDAQSPAILRQSVTSAGTEANQDSHDVAMSGDGRFVAFASLATNLVPNDTNDQADIFVRDRLLQLTNRVSISSSGGQATGGYAEMPLISDNGRFVAFFSNASGLVTSDAPFTEDVFVHDRDTDDDGLFDEPGQIETTRVSVKSDGTPGECEPFPEPCSIGQDTHLVAMTHDGRHVLIKTWRVLAAGDDSGEPDLYAHDRLTRRTVRLTASSGESLFEAGLRSISRDGRFVLATIPGLQPTSVVLDRNSNGNTTLDEPGETTVTPVPSPAPGTAFFGHTLSADGTLVVQSVFVQPGSSELWITHRLGQVSRRLTTVGILIQNRTMRITNDNRRVAFAALTATTPPRLELMVATFDADGNGHLDDQASIVATPIGAVQDPSFWDFDAALRYVGFSSRSDTLVPNDFNAHVDVFVFDRLSPAFDTFDTDGDGLGDAFEARFGLNPASSAGADGALADPDGDGLSNSEEQTRGTHPRGAHSRYLAEGATGTFFNTRISVANPGATAAAVLLRYQTDTGHTTSTLLSVPAQTRQFVNVGLVPSLASAAFSTVIESDVPVVVDRSMFWTTGLYGSHAETSVPAPATTWYLAEGATHGSFDLFYLLQNPSLVNPAQVEVSFLLPSGAPIVRSYTVAPATRLNVLVDTVPGLASTDVSGVVTSTNGVPIIVERAMYFSREGQPFAAGHASAGVTAPATTWRLAEGATGSYFDLFVLIANPSSTPAEVRTTYLRPTGAPISRTRTLAPNSRLTIYVESEDPALADTAVSTVVESTNAVPIVVERAMWWPTPGGTWQEAHNSFGATQAAARWGFADGESGAPPINTQTYFLIANATATAATVRVMLLFASGPVAAREYSVPANSRFNVPVTTEFPEAAGRGFGAVVESVGASPVPIVVERAMYSDANGVVWAAGTNVLGTPLP